MKLSGTGANTSYQFTDQGCFSVLHTRGNFGEDNVPPLET
jgi:hypothetical protein